VSIAQLSQLRVARIGRKRYQVRLLQVREASLDLLKEGESHRTLIAMDPPRH